MRIRRERWARRWWCSVVIVVDLDCFFPLCALPPSLPSRAQQHPKSKASPSRWCPALRSSGFPLPRRTPAGVVVGGGEPKRKRPFRRRAAEQGFFFLLFLFLLLFSPPATAERAYAVLAGARVILGAPAGAVLLLLFCLLLSLSLYVFGAATSSASFEFPHSFSSLPLPHHHHHLPPPPPKQQQQQQGLAALAPEASADSSPSPDSSNDLNAVVESLGDLAPPWLKLAALGEQAKGEAFAPAPAGTGPPPPPRDPRTPRALPYPSPSPDAWLAADPCHAEPNPCAAVAPFTYDDVKSARSNFRGGRLGGTRGRLPAPAHLAPLTPTAPWSSVSGPGGAGPNPYWVTGQAATSIPGLSPTFGPQQPAESMVLMAAAEAPIGKDTGSAAAAAAASAAASSSSSSSTSARRRSLLLASTSSSAAPSPSSPPPPPRASWAGALSKSSPALLSSNNGDNSNGGRLRFSATPLVVDTDGDGYRFQVSSAGNWVPSLALYRGEFVVGAEGDSEKKNDQLIASSSGPLAGDGSGPNSAALSVTAPLKRGELYTLVITSVAGASAESDDPEAEPESDVGGSGSGGSNGSLAASSSAATAPLATAVGDWVALASGPGGVYPDSTSIPPRWTVSASTSSSSGTAAASVALKRPAAAVGSAGDNVATIPFVAAAAGKGFEWRVTSSAASSSSSSTPWSPWAAVYELGAFQAAAAAGGKALASAAAPEGSTSVTLKDLALEGDGTRYVLVVGGKSRNGGEFTAEVFGPEAVKGYVSAAADLGGVSTTTPPATTPPAVEPEGAPESALAPAPARRRPRVTPTPAPPQQTPAPTDAPTPPPTPQTTAPTDAPTTPKPTDPPTTPAPPTPTPTEFVDPPPPPPVPFVQYGISVKKSFFLV